MHCQWKLSASLVVCDKWTLYHTTSNRLPNSHLFLYRKGSESDTHDKYTLLLYFLQKTIQTWKNSVQRFDHEFHEAEM